VPWHARRHTVVSSAKMTEQIKMLFGFWARVGRMKRQRCGLLSNYFSATCLVSNTTQRATTTEVSFSGNYNSPDDSLHEWDHTQSTSTLSSLEPGFQLLLLRLSVMSSAKTAYTLCSEKSDTFVFPYVFHAFWTNLMKLSQ